MEKLSRGKTIKIDISETNFADNIESNIFKETHMD